MPSLETPGRPYLGSFPAAAIIACVLMRILRPSAATDDVYRCSSAQCTIAVSLDVA